MQVSAASCASISVSGFSVFAKSTIVTCPVFLPGNASSELLLLGHNTQRPVDKTTISIKHDIEEWLFGSYVYV